MPYSDIRFDGILQAWVMALRFHTHSWRPRAIDIGAGAGKTSDLIRPMVAQLDAIEVFEPYVERFGLKQKYDHVFVEDVDTLSANWFARYDIAIIGDALEHLTVQHANLLLLRLKNAHCMVFVQVPFLYKQEAFEGNEAERHHQDDLTRAVMAERYPALIKIHADERLGCYYQMP